MALLLLCLCVFIKLRITAQSGPVILVILCHSHWSSQGVCVCVCVCAFFPFILDVKFVGCTSRDHIDRRKVARNFSSTFLLRCMPFFSREKDSAVWDVLTIIIVLHLLGFFFFFFFSEEKSQLPGFELTSQRVRRLWGYQLSYRGDRLLLYIAGTFNMRPIHTKSECGKKRRILIGPWWPAKAALVRNYLEVYWPCAGGLSGS